MILHSRPNWPGLLYPLLVALLLALLALLLASRAAAAQAPVSPAHADPSWKADYWANMDLSGPPRLEREEATLDHDWGDGSPDGALPYDHFSARWTRYIEEPPGVYHFTATSDDGIRVFVDDQLIINQWTTHPAQTFEADVKLAAGHHWVRVEYFENEGVALVKLTWRPVSQEGSGGWIDLSPVGFASWAASGYLKIDGLSVDINTFGDAGQPYRVEQWVDGQLVYSTGNFQAGEPTFLVRPYVDNYTPWQCSP